jgi:hypothetical protein
MSTDNRTMDLEGNFTMSGGTFNSRNARRLCRNL